MPQAPLVEEANKGRRDTKRRQIRKKVCRHEQRDRAEESKEGDGDDRGQGEHVVLHLSRFPDFVIEVACGLGDA